MKKTQMTGWTLAASLSCSLFSPLAAFAQAKTLTLGTGLATPNSPLVTAASMDIPSTRGPEFQHTLEQQAGHPLRIHYSVVKHGQCLVLATYPMHDHTFVELYRAQTENGKWILAHEENAPRANRKMQIVERRPFPQRSSFLDKGYSFEAIRTSFADFEGDWAVFGYSTDPGVKSIRIQLKNRIKEPLYFDRRCFIAFLDPAENRDFVEVQGLNATSKVVQRWNGESKLKPKVLSPQHSELP